MRPYFICLFICFLPFSIHALGVEQDTLIKIWIDLGREGEYLAIAAYCENRAGFVRELSYSLLLEKTDANHNKSKSVQAGKFESFPHKPVLLASLKLNEVPGQQVKAILKINEMDTLLAMDSITISAVDKIPNSSAQQNDDQIVDSKDPVFEIGGLILNETRSKVGTTFYEKFYTQWQDPFDASDFTIKIVEMPPRGRAAQVQVFLNEHLVFFQHLQPQEEMIESAVQLAIGRADHFLRQYESIQENLNGEERMGNGIY